MMLTFPCFTTLTSSKEHIALCTGKSICGLLVDQLILSQSTEGGNIL
nr:hypothetical protein Iba_scaffold53605CG0010 [Ipomoea batatas]